MIANASSKILHFLFNAKRSCSKSLYYNGNNPIKGTFSPNRHRGDSLVFLHVPYTDRELVKSKGAMWDAVQKKWYITDDVSDRDFTKWMVVYLDVSYSEKDLAKKAGAKWDPEKKKWYISKDKYSDAFKKWMVTPPLDVKNVLGSDLHQEPNKAPILIHQLPNKAPKPLEIPNDLVFIFDIETNGLPTKHEQFGKYHPYNDLSKYESSRIVQMSGLLCKMQDWSIIETQNVIIKADGFPIENDSIHGITYGKSMNEGISFVKAFESFILPSLYKANYLIAHNVQFDINILKSELYRYKLFETIDYLNKKVAVKCSMSETKNLVKSLNKYGKLKDPSLKELYHFATGKEIQNQHNALYDVINLHEALKKLNFKIN